MIKDVKTSGKMPSFSANSSGMGQVADKIILEVESS